MIKFLRIAHIDDILFAIRDCDEFIVAEKEGYTVINYIVSTSTTFPPVDFDDIFASHIALARRECRGIIFCSKTGKILRRPYHKFFNLGEREETLRDNIDFSIPHIIMDKLDGSMVVPFVVNNELRWGTKMGVTEVALPVEKFVSERPFYADMAMSYITEGMSPIFEWCSPQQKIVLAQPEDKLILTAIRNMVTGEYLPLPEKIPNIPICPAWQGNSDDIDKFIEHVRGEVDIEGYVIRFASGEMIKLKCDWYVALHKIKEQVNSERSVLELWVNNTLDDAIGYLDAPDRERIEKFIDTVEEELKRWAKETHTYMRTVSAAGTTRKEFALGPAQTLPPLLKSTVFVFWGTSDISEPKVYEHLLQMLKKSLTNNKAYDIFKNQVFDSVAY